MDSLQLKSFHRLFDLLSEKEKVSFLLQNGNILEQFIWSVEIEGERDKRYFFARSADEITLALSRNPWLRQMMTDYYSVEGGIRTIGSNGCRICGKGTHKYLSDEEWALFFSTEELIYISNFYIEKL